jgi:hypothetical protein
MKVTIKKESLDILTVNEHEHAKQIVRDMRDDEMPLNDYAEYAAHAILGSGRYGKNDVLRGILKASASITRDIMTDYDRFGEGCGYLNVWIEAIAETYDGFVKFGCLLSDIWNLDGSAEMKSALCNHAYIQYAAFER